MLSMQLGKGLSKHWIQLRFSEHLFHFCSKWLLLCSTEMFQYLSSSNQDSFGSNIESYLLHYYFQHYFSQITPQFYLSSFYYAFKNYLKQMIAWWVFGLLSLHHRSL